MDTVEDPQSPMPESLALIGGGRWSRVLMSVVHSMVQENAHPPTTITWVTNHGFEAASQWCQEHKTANVRIVRRVDDLLDVAPPAAAIVANASEQHYQTVLMMLNHGAAVLCEKPLALTSLHATSLDTVARKKGLPLGTNLVFLFANYLRDFADLVAPLSIRSVSVQWQDPAVEVRHQERKSGNFQTFISDDMLPHAWSLVRSVFPTQQDCWIDRVDYGPREVLFYGKAGVADLSVCLSRRSDQRVRRVTINDNEAELDFSVEPGRTVFRGTQSRNVWRGDRPLRGSLQSFFDVIQQPASLPQWSLASNACLPAVTFTENATTLLCEALDQKIKEFMGMETFDPSEADHQSLLIDRFAPQSKDRIDFSEPSSRQAFSLRLWKNHVIKKA